MAADDLECLDDDFRQLSAFPGATADGATATDFINANDGMQAILDGTDAETVADVAGVDAANLSNDEDADSALKQPCTAAELSLAFSFIRRFCGTIEGRGLDSVERLNNIENGLMSFMAKNKRQSSLMPN